MKYITNELALKEILGIDENVSLKESYDLEEFDWDSMAIVMLQTHIDSEFGKQIDPENLPEFRTLGSIDEFINSFK